jgi:transposase
MRQRSGTGKAPAEQVVKDIRRAACKQYSEKIRIVLEVCGEGVDRGTVP